MSKLRLSVDINLHFNRFCRINERKLYLLACSRNIDFEVSTYIMLNILNIMNNYEFYKRSDVLNIQGVIKKFADVFKIDVSSERQS